MKFIKLMKASGLALGLAIGAAGQSALAQDKQVAYLSASSANTWLGASVVEMQKVADANGIKMVEFDAQFDPARQQRSCRMRLHPASTTALSSVPSTVWA